MDLVITDAGRVALLRTLAGDATLNFSKIEFGSGSQAVPEEATSLAQMQISVGITSVTWEEGENYATVVSVFNNSAIESGFRATEVGIYVSDPDDAEEDILYAYGYSASNAADWIPPSSDRLFEENFSFIIYVDDVINVTATLSTNANFATKAELNELSSTVTQHVEDYHNPHRMTAEQLGLGNVPNVSTNNQTPTYSEAEELSELTSGEVLATAFGKLKKAVKSLIDHISDRGNPHGVTVSQLGGADNLYKIHIGYYVGDSSTDGSSRDITLGFSPAAVIVAECNKGFGDGPIYGGMALPGRPVMNSSYASNTAYNTNCYIWNTHAHAVMITDTGFKVGYHIECGDGVFTNYSNCQYRYIAFEAL